MMSAAAIGEGGNMAASVGDLQSNPNNKNDGFSLIDSWGVFRYAHSTPGKMFVPLFAIFVSMFL